ncbi:hypothetical protein KI387_034654, partial [Taxus chinensis]
TGEGEGREWTEEGPQPSRIGQGRGCGASSGGGGVVGRRRTGRLGAGPWSGPGQCGGGGRWREGEGQRRLLRRRWARGSVGAASPTTVTG